MRESTVQVRIPDPLLKYGLQAEDIQRRVTEWLVLSLFTDGRVSSGKAAALLGVSRVAFLAMLRQRGIAYIDLTPEELDDEFQAVDDIEVDPSR